MQTSRLFCYWHHIYDIIGVTLKVTDYFIQRQYIGTKILFGKTPRQENAKILIYKEEEWSYGITFLNLRESFIYVLCTNGLVCQRPISSCTELSLCLEPFSQLFYPSATSFCPRLKTSV